MITFLLAIIAILLGMIVLKLYPTLFSKLMKVFFFTGLVVAAVVFAVYSDPSLEVARIILYLVTLVSLSYAFSYLIHKLSGADNLFVYLVGITLTIVAIISMQFLIYEALGVGLFFDMTE